MATAHIGYSVTLHLRRSSALEQPTNRNRSEAEPEVLADYVVELFGAPGSKEQIKRKSLHELADFLGDCG